MHVCARSRWAWFDSTPRVPAIAFKHTFHQDPLYRFAGGVWERRLANATPCLCDPSVPRSCLAAIRDVSARGADCLSAHTPLPEGYIQMVMRATGLAYQSHLLPCAHVCQDYAPWRGQRARDPLPVNPYRTTVRPGTLY